MLKGNIYLVNDQNMALSMAPTHMIICISGETHNYQDFVNATGASIASVFVPSYEALMAELDGNMPVFVERYYEQLMGKECTEFIALILRGLYNGKNIVLYLTKEESEMAYVNYLSHYFTMYYGLSIGTPSNECSFNIEFAPVVLTTMYLNGLMTAEEFLVEYPVDLIMDNSLVLNRLIKEMRPYGPSTLPEFVMYFNDHMRKIRELRTLNQTVVIPVRGVN